MSGNPVAIDALPQATLPLVGTEVTPIVQNGATRQVAVSVIAGTQSLSYTIETASFAATAGVRYGLLTSSAAITATLPAAVLGNAIEIADVTKQANVNHITLSAHAGDSIVYQTSTAASQTIATPGAVVRLICYAANTWRALLIASA